MIDKIIKRIVREVVGFFPTDEKNRMIWYLTSYGLLTSVVSVLGNFQGHPCRCTSYEQEIFMF